MIERLRRLQHPVLALGSVWLLATSPWIGMRRALPDNPTLWDLSHVFAGLALAALSVSYFLTQATDGGWRRHFPWLAGRARAVGRDLVGLIRGRIPASDGHGMFPAIQGVLLVLLLATAATGVGWLIADGTRAALAWRTWHVLLANAFGWVLLAHALSGVAHLLEFFRE